MTDVSARNLKGTLKTVAEGTLSASVTGTFTGKTEDEAGTMTVTLNPGALWKNTGTSTVATVHAENGIIRPDGGAALTIGTYDGKNGALDLKDGKGGETVTIGTYSNENGTVLLDVDPTKNYGADTLTVTEGFTQKAIIPLKRQTPMCTGQMPFKGRSLPIRWAPVFLPSAYFLIRKSSPCTLLRFIWAKKATNDGATSILIG